MEMFHVQPVLLLLVASLFFLPALRAATGESSVDFQYCSNDGYDYGKVNRVQVEREVDTFAVDIYGSATKDISAATYIYISYRIGESEGRVKTFSLCKVTECNSQGQIKAGTNFLLMLREVPVIGSNKDIRYLVYLLEGIKTVTIAEICVMFKLPTSTSALVSA